MIAQKFHQDWTFWRGRDGKKERVALPHDGMIATDRDPDQQNYFLLVGYHGDLYQYEKTFYVPGEYEGQCVYLEFEGVYCMTSVYVNDVLVKEKHYGFTAFDVEISRYLKYDAENVIRVTADIPYDGHNRWYTGGGIYRPVNLYVAPKDHIALYGVKVTTLDIDPARIAVDTQIEGEGEVRVTVYDGENPVAAGQGAHVEFEIPEAKLWSADTPHLYQAVVTLEKDGEVLDRAEETFGIRTISVSAETGLLVNGKREFLRGGCIHNDNGVIGVINNDATELRRAKNIKRAGFNAIRSAHHPMSRSLMKACDICGIYVMDEAFDYWYRPKMQNPYLNYFMDEFKEDVTAMVQDAYNHPSVIMYSIGNEIPEAGGVKGVRIGKEMVDVIHSIDRTRLTTLCPSVHWLREYLDGVPYLTVDEDEWMAQDEKNREADWKHYMGIFMGAAANIPDDEKGMEYPPTYIRMDEDATKNLYPYLDVAGYNYYEDRYDVLHELHPERPLLGTETRADRIVHTMEYARKHPYLIGDFIWTLQDHIGEANCSNVHYGELELQEGKPAGMQGKDYPWYLNYGGVVDLLGDVLPSIHKFELAWGMKKGIFLASQPPIHDGIDPELSGYKWTDTVSGWTYEGCEGKKTFIDTYSDAYETEVFVNGKSIGRKRQEEYFAKFPCIYEPGEVVAVGYDEEGTELYRTTMATAGTETKITAVPDKTTLSAGGEDFSFINISITDAAGELKRLPERKVEITVEGCGTLQGFGSAAPINDAPFDRTAYTTYLGRLQAVVRSGEEKGDIVVTLRSEGLEDVVLHLSCE